MIPLKEFIPPKRPAKPLQIYFKYNNFLSFVTGLVKNFAYPLESYSARKKMLHICE